MARSGAQASHITIPTKAERRRLVFLAAALSIAAAFACFVPVGTPVSPRDPNIEYVGRWDKSDPSRYHSYWGGAYLRVRFTGTSIRLKLAAPATVFVNIDGHEEELPWQISGTATLNEHPLKDGAHTLTLASFFQTSEIQFQGFILDRGAKTLPPATHKPLIEFVGDSITCGDKTSRWNLSAYPWLTGEALGCDHTQIAQCGITLSDGYIQWFPNAPKRGMQIQYFLQKEPNLNPNPAWDFRAYIPNVVVINLGTNDGLLHVPPKLFEQNYRGFLQQIREKYPNTVVAAMRPVNGAYAEQIAAAVAGTSEDDDHIHYIDTTGWLTPGSDFAPDGYHPSDEGQRKIAARLTPILKAYLAADGR